MIDLGPYDVEKMAKHGIECGPALAMGHIPTDQIRASPPLSAWVGKGEVWCWVYEPVEWWLVGIAPSVFTHKKLTDNEPDSRITAEGAKYNIWRVNLWWYYSMRNSFPPLPPERDFMELAEAIVWASTIIAATRHGGAL